jgi:MFS family permease
VSVVIQLVGWRFSFVVTALLGVAWAAGWYAFYRRPQDHAWIGSAELDYIERGGARGVRAERKELPWRDLFRYRTVLGMAAGFFCLSFVIYFFITWFPTYLREARGFTNAEIGTYGMIPPLVASVGGWCGGLFSDWLVRSGRSLTVARKTPILLGMCGSTAIALAAVAPSAALAITWLTVSYASLAFAAAGVWALPSDVAPTSSHVGSIGGIQNFASNAAGIVLPPLVGWLLDVTGNNYTVPLMLAGAVGVVGALIYAFVVGEIRPLPIPEAKKT